MNLEEAQIIAQVISHVDGDCPHCVGGMVEKLREAFPQFDWTIDHDTTKVTVNPKAEA